MHQEIGSLLDMQEQKEKKIAVIENEPESLSDNVGQTLVESWQVFPPLQDLRFGEVPIDDALLNKDKSCVWFHDVP